MPTRPVNMKRMKLSDMKPAEYNPRTIDDVSKAGLASSIDEFGLVEPIIVNTVTGNIVGGHQRYNKLLEEGTTETDVVEVELTVEKEKMLNITLNNTNITGTYDAVKLQPMLDDIKAQSFNLFNNLNLSNIVPSMENFKPKLPSEKQGHQMNDPKFEIVIDCVDEAEQESIYYKIQEMGIPCRLQSL